MNSRVPKVHAERHAANTRAGDGGIGCFAVLPGLT